MSALLAGDWAAPVRELDLRGEVCPYTFLKTKLVLEEMAAGATLRVLVDNEPSARDVPRSVQSGGHVVLAVEAPRPGSWAITIKKGDGPSA